MFTVGDYTYCAGCSGAAVTEDRDKRMAKAVANGMPDPRPATADAASPAPVRGEPRISTDLRGQTIYDAGGNVLGTVDERNNWHPVWE